MTIKERLVELIEDGGVLTIFYGDRTNAFEFILAGVLWLHKPFRLRWCAVFPEHGCHIHEMEYDAVKFDNDERDILFYKNNQLIAGVVPYIESSLSVDEVREALAEWQELVAYGGNADEFADFLEHG